MATGARIRWFGNEVEKAVQQKVVRLMHAATNHLKEATRRNLNARKTRTQGPSKVGEIPHVDLGTLRDSIFRRVDVSANKVTGDVGTKLGYGIHHELKGRPFLRPTLKMEQNKLAQIFTKGSVGPVTLSISSET